MYPNILIVSNLLFISISTTNTFIKDIEPRYMAAGIGGILLNEIYTFSEIKKQYPDCKEAKSFLDVEKVYRQH